MNLYGSSPEVSPSRILMDRMNWKAQRGRPLPPARDKYMPRGEPLMTRIEKFWQRVTDGMKLNELWNQFQADARSSYRLYSQDVDSTRSEERRVGKEGRSRWS